VGLSIIEIRMHIFGKCNEYVQKIVKVMILKILYVVSLFPCWSETFIVREMLALKRRGVDVVIFSLKQPEEKTVQSDVAFLADSVIYPVGLLKATKRNFNFLVSNFGVIFKLLLDITVSMYKTPIAGIKSIIVMWRTLGALPDILKQDISWIHAHWATYPSTSAMVMSKIIKIPFSFTAHAHDIFEENQLLNQKYNAATFGVTISKYNKEYLSRKLHRPFGGELNIIHCGVDLSVMPYTRSGRDLNNILAVGRLDEIKGFKYLIEACSVLKANNISFKCKIVGDGPLKAELVKMRDDFGLQQDVEFLGVLKQEEVRNILARATMFVLPSVKTSTGNMDGIPVALMEAMATGLPVISTYVSGIPELIEDGVSGYLCEPKNSKELAEKITLLVSDSELQEEFSKSARLKVERQFSIELEADKLLQLFSEGMQSCAKN